MDEPIETVIGPTNLRPEAQLMEIIRQFLDFGEAEDGASHGHHLKSNPIKSAQLISKISKFNMNGKSNHDSQIGGDQQNPLINGPYPLVMERDGTCRHHLCVLRSQRHLTDE